MKRMLGMVLLVFIISAVARANVDVLGESSIMVVPDQVRITVGVETRAKSLPLARKKTDKKIAAILKVLKNNGVLREDVQLDHIVVSPLYKNYESLILKGYNVQKKIVFCVKKVETFEQIMALVLEAGANNVNGIEFETTALEALKVKARKQAMQAAKTKAAYLAHELDLQIGPAIQISDITENQAGPSRQRFYAKRVADTVGRDSAFSIGQIEITAQVRVSFKLEE